MPREQYYNTAEQVRGYLRDALGIVDELDVPDDLRVSVFDKAVQLLSAKAVMADPTPVPHVFADLPRPH